MLKLISFYTSVIEKFLVLVKLMVYETWMIQSLVQ